MPGLATRLLIADLVLNELEGAEPALFNAISAGENRKWYMLGALGPAIGDFIPNEAGSLGARQARSPYYSIWKQVLRIAVGDPNASVPGDPAGLPGLVQTLRTLTKVVDQLSTLVNDHDFDGIKALSDSGELDGK
jgi:hypothetical protein